MPLFGNKDDEMQILMTEICTTLRNAGVPDERLPTPASLIHHMVSWIDKEKKEKWVNGYIELEQVKELIKAPKTGIKLPVLPSVKMEDVNEGAKKAGSAVAGMFQSIKARLDKKDDGS